jgi:hypothetical protein
MPYCPNPDCAHRKRLGEPAEFNNGVTTCSDCGGTLSEATPVFEPLEKTPKEVVGWKCLECGEVNSNDLAKCVCGYDANRPFIATPMPDINAKEGPVIQASKRIDSYSAVIKRTVLLSIINFFVANLLLSFLPFNIGSILFNVGRVIITFYAGWLVIENNVGGLWKAAATGPVVYCIDHIILKGGMFLIMYLVDPKGQGLLAFSGVLASYVMFLPIILTVGLLGGLLAKSRRKKLTTDAK